MNRFNFRPKTAKSGADGKRRVLAQWRGWDWSAEEKGRAFTAKKSADVMSHVMQSLGIDRRLSETEILRVWRHLLDPNIAAHAHPVGLRNGTLFVNVDSNVWLDEIVRYRRREILDRMQSSFGRDLITRISFRVG